MTDDELATFLGIPRRSPEREKILAAITPKERASYEHMREFEAALRAWIAAGEPEPRPDILKGAIMCRRNSHGPSDDE